jgi:hypothetical protein
VAEMEERIEMELDIKKDEDIEGYQAWLVSEEERIELELDRIRNKDKANKLFKFA